MRCLAGEQVESLFDEALPLGVRELPEDLARLDELLSDPALLEPIVLCWAAAAPRRAITAASTIAMSLFVRLMVVKQRSGWATRRWCGRCCPAPRSGVDR